MSAQARTASQSDVADSLRKRVCKACDRCRLKKSKCDGSSPCSRCKADNAICVFGERKKSHDKIYPKGYVEMLEQQQSQLVAGLQETYRLLRSAKAWPGAALSEAEGQPLTHDILARLDIISSKTDGESEHFEEDCERLQQRLISQGAPYMPRRSSFGSDSEHSHSHKRSRSCVETPIPSPAKPVFRQSFDFDRTRTSSPATTQSPVLQSAQSNHSAIKPSPLHNESPVQLDSIPPIEDDVLLTTWDWSNMGSNANTNADFTPQFTFNPAGFPPQMQSAFGNWQGFELHQVQFDTNLMNSFTNQTPGPLANMSSIPDWHGGNEQPQQQQPMDLDFSKFVQVAT